MITQGFIGHQLAKPKSGRTKLDMTPTERAEHKREINRRWAERNPEAYKAHKRRDQELHKDRIAEYGRKRHQRLNTERDIQRITAWKDANPNRVARSRLLRNTKDRANTLALPHNIVLEDLTIPEVCPVLGIQIVFGQKHVQPGSPTVDRIVPELGYVRGNIAVISHRANQIKSNGTIADHEAVIRYMREHLG